MSEGQHPLNALPRGHRLQEYELVRVLGMGGFGMTYLGFDHHLNKAVAIKEYLPSDIATRTTGGSVAPQASEFRGDFQWGLERFLDEARTLARFDHRHIVKVHRFFEAHGTAYIVMEYAEGETLSAHLERKGTLTEAELKALLYPLLDGLEVVHKADFLHRDIKPGNIVLRDADGSPVLLDFGAARQAIGAKSRSVTSIVTPGYAPIEQYSSRGHQGAWTDLYALGGVCYRALTGQVPEDATDRVRHDPLVPVSQRCAGQASQAFLSAIDAALSVDEGARPPSVGVWREALGVSVPVPARGQAQGASRRAQATQRVPLPAPAARAGPAEEVVDAVAAAQRDRAADAPVVRRSEPNAPPSKSPNQPLFKWLVVVLGVVAVLVGGKMYLDHAEQVALEQRQEQAALERQRQEEQAALEKQRREQAALERQRQEEQVALEKQRREQAALEKQRQEEQAVLKKAGVDNLHDAASKNAYEAAEVLLRQGADVNAKNEYGWTPLHRAAEENASATAEVLLKHGADVHAKHPYDDDTPLHRAAEENASATAEVLLKHGADVNAEDDWNMTPLHRAARAGASATAEVLLKHGADVHAKHRANSQGFPHGADVNTSVRVYFGDTALHKAAQRGGSATAELLLKHGADVNAKNRDGLTPLHDAAWKKAFSTAELLLRHGADVQAKDANGWTPLHWAAQTALGGADLPLLTLSLLKQGAAVDARDKHGWTPLHVTAWYDAFSTTEVLLRQKAAVDARDKYGWTPLHVAAKYDAFSTAEVLLKQGANVQAKDNRGSTPLHHAVSKNASATAAVLRRYGARK